MSDIPKRHKWERGIESRCTVCGLRSRYAIGASGLPSWRKEFSTDGGKTWTEQGTTPPCGVKS